MLGCMSFSSAERAKLADLLLDLGPAAPTLCEGWDTRELAIHLLIRENHPVASAGIFLPLAEGKLAKMTSRYQQQDYGEIVRTWAAGPPPRSVWRMIDEPANSVEHFVHHEDVRRGGGVIRPRDFSVVIQRLFHHRLRTLAPRMLRGSEVPLILMPEGFSRVVAADSRGVAEDGGDVIRLSGEVGELLLWTFGRDAVALKAEGDLSRIHRSSL